MRSAVMAAAVLASALSIATLGPAQAQMGGGGGRHGGGDQGKSDQKKPQVDEKAYKAALDRIPEPKEKYDPWGGARPTTPDSKKAK
jgi:glycine/D-amino acid oxidase-like deaminating enzyme